MDQEIIEYQERGIRDVEIRLIDEVDKFLEANIIYKGKLMVHGVEIRENIQTIMTKYR